MKSHFPLPRGTGQAAGSSSTFKGDRATTSNQLQKPNHLHKSETPFPYLKTPGGQMVQARGIPPLQVSRPRHILCPDRSEKPFHQIETPTKDFLTKHMSGPRITLHSYRLEKPLPDLEKPNGHVAGCYWQRNPA